jgi:hypothetical protein
LQAAQFVRGDAFVSARRTTADSGIGALLAAHDIVEFVFEPCGYSMNGLMGGAFSTIHITPEAACSYASVELTGCPLEDTAAFVAKVFSQDPPLDISYDCCAPNAALTFWKWGLLYYTGS